MAITNASFYPMSKSLSAVRHLQRISAPFVFSAVISFTSAVHAQQAVWSQYVDYKSQVGPSSHTTRNPIIDREVADDFELVGSVQSISVEGEYNSYFHGPAMNFQSAYVRFYEWQNGVPGALQYERQIPASAITVTGTAELGE